MHTTSRFGPYSPLLLLVLAAAAACRGSEAPETPPAEDHPAIAFERAKAEAREGAIEETYVEWRAAFHRYSADTVRVEEAREETDSANPVRTLEELLRDGDPEAYDPEVRAHYEAWVALSEEFEARLLELRNDPRSDPRSPLLPEVRAALRADE